MCIIVHIALLSVGGGEVTAHNGLLFECRGQIPAHFMSSSGPPWFPHFSTAKVVFAFWFFGIMGCFPHFSTAKVVFAFWFFSKMSWFSAFLHR